MANQRWVTIGVILGLLFLVFGLLIPAIQNAREEARKSTSKNNLKQIGIAFHSYNETHGCLPPGGTIRDDGKAMHGWQTLMLPFLDASPLYNWTDFNEPWNSPVNVPVLETRYPVFLNPGENSNFTIHGYGVTNYLANPNLLCRNSGVKFKQIKKGLSHTWMAGEVTGNFQPWGYPFNWRPLGSKLCDGPKSFGCSSWDGGHLLFANGSVSYFSDQTSPKILKSLATAPPVATQEQTVKAATLFQTGNFHWDRIDLQSDPQGKKKYLAKVLRNNSEKPLALYLFDALKRSPAELGQRKVTIDRLYYLFEINTTSNITALLKSTSLVNESTSEQFQENVKTLRTIQKQLP